MAASRLILLLALALGTLLPVGALADADAVWRGRGVLSKLGIGGAEVRASTFDDAVRHVRGLPPLADGRVPIAAEASDVGHWRLVNRAGEPFTAADAAELTRAWATIAPEAGGRLDLIALHVSEDTIFRHGAHVAGLPEGVALRAVLADGTARLLRVGRAAQRGLFVEVGNGMLVEARERDLFHETIWQLGRLLPRAAVRTLALEPGGPTALRHMPLVDTASRRAAPDAIDPGHLARGLGPIAGQTALASGRMDGGRLAYKPAKGPEAHVEVSNLMAAAESADVNLIVLDTSSARQPGTRNWLWQRVELGNIDAAIERRWLGAFLAALAGEDVRVLVRPERQGESRLLLRLEARAGPAGGAIETIADAVTGTWSDLVSETAGRVSIRGLSASLLTRARQQELDRRLVPGIPSVVQLGYLVLMALGLAGLPVALGWWRRLWPPEVAAEYAGAAGYHLARLVRWAAFAGAFLPLAGFGAVVVGLGRLARRLAGGRSGKQPQPEAGASGTG